MEIKPCRALIFTDYNLALSGLTPIGKRFVIDLARAEIIVVASHLVGWINEPGCFFSMPAPFIAKRIDLPMLNVRELRCDRFTYSGAPERTGTNFISHPF